jgi:hypothetical protein
MKLIIIIMRCDSVLIKSAFVCNVNNKEGKP